MKRPVPDGDRDVLAIARICQESDKALAAAST
jgi:hypothetical protein